jgi:UPF0755 protein
MTLSFSGFFGNIRKFLLKILILLSIIASLCLYCTFGPSGIFREYDIGQERTIIIRKGSNLSQVCELLAAENIIPAANSFLLSAVASGNRKKIKHGEFKIPSKISPWELAELLASGKTVVHKFTFVEGQSVRQAVKMLEENVLLTGDIKQIPPEGFILPETYQYQYGDDRQGILDNMHKSMKKFISSLAQTHNGHNLLQDEHKLLTLASLIEKETSVHEERAIVAAVYLNRLAANMRLQCDPTVVYALTQGEKLDRPLTYDDLKTESPYNTYTITGLPVGPIACPGKTSILAALNPADTQALFFVANGQGGHNFSKTLDEHNNHVKNWRAIQNQKKLAKNDNVDITKPAEKPEVLKVLPSPKILKTNPKKATPKKVKLKSITLKKIKANQLKSSHKKKR